MHSITFTPRLYQETILETINKSNTLVVLGTGLGKTKISILSAVHRLNILPDTKILFLTPTKPLANQIYEEFKASTNIQNITLFTGETRPDLREQLIQTAKIIISTPQTISNDIINKRINLEEFSLLVIDEAHRAVKDYDYVWISKQYKKTSAFPRILGLTASPGSDVEQIQEILKNLAIEEVEVRTDEDPDVKPYIQELEKEFIRVDLPKEYQEIQNYLAECLKSRLLQLKNFNLIKRSQVSKKEIIGLQAQIQKQIAMGHKEVRLWTGISLAAQCIKVMHAQELVETQGLEQTYKYLKSFYDTAETTKVKAVKNLVKDLNFKSAYILTKNLLETKTEHPKLTKLKEIVLEELKKDPQIKVIIFTQYRDTAKIIQQQLPSSKIFVGQMKKEGTGMSQKEQIQTLKDFAEGKFNILIGTSVTEEGIDIPKVNIVIFYEPIPSAIRQIQRQGRTARLKEGKVIILITSNTRDETYHWVAQNKERQMYKILKNIKSKVNTEKQPTLQQYSKEQEFEVLVDTRERASPVVRELTNQNIKVKTQQLEIGDYILSKDLAIERKTQEDFVRSIIDHRLLNQVQELKRNYKKPLIILEGDNDIYSLMNMHPNAIRGMLTTITLIYNVPILYTKNPRDTTELILTLIKQIKKDSSYFESLPKKKPLDLPKQQEYFISGLPGIGGKTAKELLKEFKTIQNIINASEADLKKVPKLGEKKVTKLKDLFSKEYKES